MLIVALVAGLMFVGGAAAIYLSSPQGTDSPGPVGNASARPSLAIFEQPTPTPSPEPSPTFILLSPSPFGSPLPSESPLFTPGSFDPFATPTPIGPPTSTPTATATIPPTPVPPQAGFTRSIDGLKVTFTYSTSGEITRYDWAFGDGETLSTTKKKAVVHTYGGEGEYTVTLTVTGPGGVSQKQKTFSVAPPATPSPTAAPTATPACTQDPSPPPTCPTAAL